MANVLFIEPDHVLARTYVQALRHAGHSVVRTGYAQEAINAADAQKPDIVVLEFQLAAHNGIEFLHEFRSYPEWQQIPVIVNTYLSPAVLAPLQSALEQDLGVKACLYKPRTTLEQLIRVVNEQIAALA